MSTTKATRVTPAPTAEYIKGTEAPNYYLVIGENDDAIFGFRPLATAVPAIGSAPVNGETTRFRVVPKNQADADAIGAALSILNFEKRQYGAGDDIHFSTVVSDAASFAVKVAKLVDLLGCC